MNLYIARDKDGSLGTIRLRNDSFPKITFENSPQEVELKLINEL